MVLSKVRGATSFAMSSICALRLLQQFPHCRLHVLRADLVERNMKLNGKQWVVWHVRGLGTSVKVRKKAPYRAVEIPRSRGL